MIQTYQIVVWNVDKAVDNLENDPQIEEAAEFLRKGEVVAFPTETVYGLGADASNQKACEKIFLAKGRPQDNPLIVHVAEHDQLHQVAQQIPNVAWRLIEAFWPGPLTLILPANQAVAPAVTAGLDTVGVRMPDHPVALALIRKADRPLAAPSANRSGRPSPTLAQHVMEDMNGKIAGIVDGGAAGIGLESTVLDVTGDIPVILRPGGLSKEEMEAVIGTVKSDAGAEEAPRSPGMKYRHYAPQAKMLLLEADEIKQEILKHADKKVGVLTTEENRNAYPQADVVIACGRRSELTSVAAHLFEALRQFDQNGVDVILCETFPEKEIGVAIMNRLRKAAED